MSKEKITDDIDNCVRQNICWENLPEYLRKQVLHDNQRVYEKYVFNYSLKNQLRFRGNLVAKLFRHEQRYYELLVQKSINGLCLFPYHLSDIITKGLRVTPFNYYLDVLNQLLRNDKSYDTLPNFTAADCLRVLGIGRNEYLSLISELKTHSSRLLHFTTGYKPNPLDILPRFPVRIYIEPWWHVELGYVLETDIQYVNATERALIDDLIDFGSHIAGKCDYNVIHSLYRKGLIYLNVPISGDDRISIPPLRNFVMNRVSGDYFESLLYKIFVSADEYMTIAELAQMLQVELDSVKQAISLFCRLGFARLKDADGDADSNTDADGDALKFGKSKQQTIYHPSWSEYLSKGLIAPLPQLPQITPLNYNSIMMAESATNPIKINSTQLKQQQKKLHASDNLSSDDGNKSDSSLTNGPQMYKDASNRSSFEENDTEMRSATQVGGESMAPRTLAHSLSLTKKSGEKRVGFLFDSTLTAFLMMGNLSPGLKNHAVTMFEVGKLCEESMDTFLTELEKVSLLDAEGEGDVSRYFTHAVILRSTICSLRCLAGGGLDLLRLECLESLDRKTRDRILDKKYKLIISATPLTASLSNLFRIPFLGQFYQSSDCAHMWTKLFYNQLSGYGPPSVLLCRGTVLKTLPKIFLGYGKLLVNIQHSDSYIINSENFYNINDQLRNGCVLVQGYGIRTPGELRYEAFPFNENDPRQLRWINHKAVQKLRIHLDFEYNCGYITFLNTGVPDLGCDDHDAHTHDVRVDLKRNIPIPNHHKSSSNETTKNTSEESFSNLSISDDENLPKAPLTDAIHQPLVQHTENTENNSVKAILSIGGGDERSECLKSPDENYFAASPKANSKSPANIFISDDCNELLASELAKCDEYITIMNKSSNPVAETSQNHSATPPKKVLDHNLCISQQTHEHSEEEWTLLDVNFGVPLFDVDCNTRICEQIVRKLCTDENLQILPSKSKAMNDLFLRFVKQCTHCDEEIDENAITWDHLPYPRYNLVFENGRVCLWSGR